MGIPVLVTYQHEQRMVRVPDHICNRCGTRGPSDVLVTWEAIGVFWLPLRSRGAMSQFGCLRCGAVEPRHGALPGVIPLMHRAGSAVIIGGMFALLALLLAIHVLTTNAERAEREDTRAEVARLHLKGRTLVERHRASSAACLEKWRAIVARAAPRGLLEAPEIPIAKDADWWALPVMPVRAEAADLAQIYADENTLVRPLLCAVRNLTTQFDADPDSHASVSYTREGLARLEGQLAEFAVPTRVFVVDWECARRTCQIAAAVIADDGRIVSLTRHKERFRDPTMGAADLRWGLHQRLKGLSEKDPFGD